MRIVAVGVAAAGLLAAVPADIGAQNAASEGVPVEGETIRISTAASGSTVGGFWGIEDGDLLLFGEGRTIHFPLDEVELLEVETPSVRGQTTVIGAILGLLTGAALIAGLTESDALGRHHLVIPALGVVGGVVGYRLGGPGWRTVPLDRLVAEEARP